ncbi:UNVERIFIED_CONTAM: hypothetical protein FKN15_022781 [Acipenser sinensis]
MDLYRTGTEVHDLRRSRPGTMPVLNRIRDQYQCQPGTKVIEPVLNRPVLTQCLSPGTDRCQVICGDCEPMDLYRTGTEVHDLRRSRPGTMPVLNRIRDQYQCQPGTKVIEPVLNRPVLTQCLSPGTDRCQNQFRLGFDLPGQYL